MKTPILGQAYVARSVNAADNRCVNLFPEVVPEGGKEAGFLNRAPGLRLLGAIGSGPIRGMWWHGDYAYVVSGPSLYKVTTNYTATLIGGVAGTGPVSITDNGYVMFIAANGPSYQYLMSGVVPTFTASFSGTTMTVTAVSSGTLYEGMEVFGTGIVTGTTIVSQTSGTIGGVGVYEVSISQTLSSRTFTGPAAFTQIVDDNFLGALVVAYVDTYFIYVEPNSQRVYSIDTFDTNGNYIYPLVFDATNVASAEGSPDNLVSMIVDHNELWLFGTNSVEVWYDAGTPSFPFARIQGAFNELGCAATFSVAKMENGLFWLGADARGKGIVYQANGYRGQRISTHAIEYAIAQYDNISDAIAYTYQQEGHSFYVLNFPSANATWVFDVTTGMWHERAGWNGSYFVRHRGNCQLAFNNEIMIGDHETGNVYAFDLDVYADNGQPQRWLRSWRALPAGQNTLVRTAHHSLQLDCEGGIGLTGPLQQLSTTLAIYLENGASTIWFTAYTNPASSGDLAAKLATYPYIQGTVCFPTGAKVSGSLVYDSTYGYWYTTATTTASVPSPGFVYINSTFVDNLLVQGSNPQVMLRWSDDGGHTWSSEHWADMGRIGQYYRRVLWRRLGMTMKIRDRVYEVSGSDPVKLTIVGAELKANETTA